MLVWQNCSSVLVASITLKCGEDDYACFAELLIMLVASVALKCGEDDYACFAELLISVCYKHHSEVWVRGLCLLVRTIRYQLLAVGDKCKVVSFEYKITSFCS